MGFGLFGLTIFFLKACGSWYLTTDGCLVTRDND